MNRKSATILASAIISLFGLFVTGCCDSEGKKFGYKGSDLGSKDKMFFTVGTVTNYLPARVLMTSETDYEIGEREKALISALNIVLPSAVFNELPEGYALRDKEPWFTTFVKQSKSLGFDGTIGFVAHVEPEKNTYHVSESFFSVYVNSLQEAMNVSKELRVALERDGKPLKIYSFDNSWVAEYVRMVAICVVGCRPDGRWTAMLTVRDKLNDPSLVWVPEAEQKEMLADYYYSKDIAKWQKDMAKASEQNHKLVLEKIANAKLTLFEDTNWFYDDREHVYATEKVTPIHSGEVSGEETKKLAQNAIDEVSKRFGVAFPNEELKVDELDGGVFVCRATAQSELFTLYFASEFNVDDENKNKVSKYYVYVLEKPQAEIVFPAKPTRTVK